MYTEELVPLSHIHNAPPSSFSQFEIASRKFFVLGQLVTGLSACIAGNYLLHNLAIRLFFLNFNLNPYCKCSKIIAVYRLMSGAFPTENIIVFQSKVTLELGWR
jgi:hypothetical protein